MEQKSLHLAGVLVVGLMFMGVTLARRPATEIDPARHPSLPEARHPIVQAFEKSEEAQKYYKDELGGHD